MGQQCVCSETGCGWISSGLGARLERRHRIGGAMKKNVAGQKVGCQMVSASDGSAFTGSVTVAVTIDAGTQATGSVGSGACTHEGNGYYTYAPAQAETNGNLLAFTFTGTGAVPATVQIYPSFPQTVDNATNISAIKTVTDAIPNGGALTTISTKIDTIDDFLDTEIAAIKAKTDSLTFTVAGKVDANITHVNEIEVTGDGESGTEWGPV